jgi:hypothetical protein
VRFTQRNKTLYAILLKKPVANQVAIKDLALLPDSRVQLLGGGKPLQWRAAGNLATVFVPQNLPGQHAWVLKITPAPRD